MSSSSNTNQKNNSGVTSQNSSVPVTQRPPNLTDAIAQAFTQLQQIQQSNLSGSQLYGLNPQTEQVFITDTLTTVSSVGGQNYATLTVNSVNQNNVAITGYTVNVYSKTGFGPIIQGTTPFTCTLLQGYDYIVAPLDFSPCNFNVWNDTGSSARFRRVSMGTSNQTLTATYYCTGGSGGGPSGVGVIMPLYVYPSGSSSWAALASAAAAYPTIPILLIVNPGNGPISLSPTPQNSADPVWTTALNNLVKYPNIQMIGYIDSHFGEKAVGSGSTVYTGNNTDSITNEANSYKSWYGSFITGFFIDDAIPVEGGSFPASYAGNVATALNGVIPGPYIVGNPGESLTGETSPAPEYIGVFNNWCIFEDDETGLPFSPNYVTSTAATGQAGFAASNFSYISYGYPSWTQTMANNLITSMSTVQWVNWGAGTGAGQPGGSPYDVDGQATAFLTNMLATLLANGG